MAEYSIGPLEIQGYQQKDVPNRFFRNVGPATGIAVLLPGLRYSNDMPLLYYPARYFLNKGFDILQVNTDYSSDQFSQSSPDRQIDWLGSDARAAVQTVLAQRDYPHLVLVAKSIGTLALSMLLINQPELRSRTTIWLTPLFRLPLVEQATQQLSGPALFVAGTGDSTYDPERLAYLQQHIQAEALIFPQANHSLEIPGDLPGSIDNLQEMMHGIADFVDRCVFA
ncbi:MAG: alpha/beta fold hydrolase [Anaerolineales bacterium]|jgi:pimeloyl-ACP methyl ester carboxylesterase